MRNWVFFTSPNTISGSANRWKMYKESLDIQLRFIRLPVWSDIKGIKRDMAGIVFSRGYWHIGNENDAVAATPFLRAAVRLDPPNLLGSP